MEKYHADKRENTGQNSELSPGPPWSTTAATGMCGQFATDDTRVAILKCPGPTYGSKSGPVTVQETFFMNRLEKNERQIRSNAKESKWLGAARKAQKCAKPSPCSGGNRNRCFQSSPKIDFSCVSFDRPVVDQNEMRVVRIQPARRVLGVKDRLVGRIVLQSK